jgi:hypothetical protein
MMGWFSAIGAGFRYFFSGRIQLLMVLTLLIPLLTAGFNKRYGELIALHQLAPAIFTGVAYFGGAITDPKVFSTVERYIQLLEQGLNPNQSITWSSIRQEIALEFWMASLVTPTYAMGLYIVYLISLGIDPYRPELLINGAITLVILTNLFPSLFLLLTHCLLRWAPRSLLGAIQKGIGQARNTLFAVLASFLVYELIGKHTPLTPKC